MSIWEGLLVTAAIMLMAIGFAFLMGKIFKF